MMKVYWNNLSEYEFIYEIMNGVINITVTDDDNIISEENNEKIKLIIELLIN